ncbi:MAG: preprotein translocase subunit SecA [Chloroflexota bacterium]|nr:preprotein translocase subunit SecA [Chloroflexota bacterium]
MFKNLLKKTFGDSSSKAIKGIQRYVDEINDLESTMMALPDDEFARRTSGFMTRLTEATLESKAHLAELRQAWEREPDMTTRAQMNLEILSQEKVVRGIEENILDEILPEAFALVREANRRTVGMRLYDVQLIGGVVLHRGQIAEMKTGEGKTLVATLPLFLNALTGRGVHLVTPNDYLSKVGVQWMGPAYHILGLTAAVIQSSAGDPNRGSYVYDPEFQSADDRFQYLRPITRREAYASDITYGTNNEFGFDYLRDNMVTDLGQRSQRELFFAIIDEVDNILVDEARTPLIISGSAQESSNWYGRFAELMPGLRPSKDKETADGDYVLDEKDKVVTLTEVGIEKIQGWLGIENLYSPEHFELTPYLDNALRAHVLYKLDRDYIVRNGEVVIVDEFTGRLMEGRRYSEGLHQAIEAKQGVKVQRESLTLATITFQNYFRMYDKLAGMTGTAETEKEEFYKIYGLDVVMIPTNLPVIRADHSDSVYRSERIKYNAVLDEIQACHERKQPVLVGTVAIETSEFLARLLKRRGIPHNVLNAKNHEREAVIIAQAGKPGAVTIATNMAGRGVDILLGGNPEGISRDRLRKAGYDLTDLPEEVWLEASTEAETQCELDKQIVLEAGGLHVIGTERHEARRIDNQLRGRSGRQGDHGSSRFFVALDDDLMRRFGGDRVAGLMDRLGVEDDMPLEHGMVSKSIENAQTRVEGHNFDIRKHVLEYDDVVNKQREVIYEQRRRILTEPSLQPTILDMVDGQIQRLVQTFAASEDPDERDLPGLHAAVSAILPLPAEMTAETWQDLPAAEIADQIVDHAETYYDVRAQVNAQEILRQFMGEGVTLGALQERSDPFAVTVYARIVNQLPEPLSEDLGRLPLSQLPPEIRAGLLAGLVEGAALYRDRMVMVRAVDERWVRHLTDLDSLREGIGLRAFAQVQPLTAYKKEAHEMYVALLEDIESDIVHAIYKVDVVQQQRPARRVMRTNREGNGASRQPERSTKATLGRNDPCWCGSGKKYKHCHMRSDAKGETSGGSGKASAGGNGESSPTKRSGKKRRRSRSKR